MLLGFFFENLFQLLDEFLGHFRKVLDEVQRVLDLVGYAGGQFTQRRQLLLRDDLVLRALQVAERRFELIVLALELVGQLFNQVQALNLQRVLPEYLEGGRHLRDLIATAEFHGRLQVAAGEAPHPVGEPLQPARNEATDEEPGNQNGAGDADRANGQQEDAAGEDRLR